MDKPNLFMEILFKKKHYVNFEIKAVKNPTTEEGEKKNLIGLKNLTMTQESVFIHRWCSFSTSYYYLPSV